MVNGGPDDWDFKHGLYKWQDKIEKQINAIQKNLKLINKNNMTKTKGYKKIVNKDVEKAYEILQLKTEQDRDDFFKCRCPKEIQAMGGLHRTPIDCVETPKEIISVCNYYINDMEIKLKNLKALKKRLTNVKK